jgi:hypothetical protein
VAAALVTAGDRDDGGYSFQYRGGVVTASNATATARGELLWAFGAGVQGVTPVGYLNGSYFEHRFSWYRKHNGLSVSPGHPQQIKSMYFALGLFESPEDASRCFGCHATGLAVDASGNPDVANITPGITCERCHGPGTDHAVAARTNSPPAIIRHAIFNSGRLPPKASIEVCGACHRLPLPGSMSTEPEKDDPAAVRFQPLGLLASKCFRVSGRLSCLWCHDAHGDAVRDAGYYRQKCLECHSPPPRKSKLTMDVSVVTSCKRNQKQDCLPCHMRSTSPSQNLVFTDHRIRIY